MSREQEERERRAAQNQLLFRAVNEQIVEMTEKFRSDLSDLNLVCECWDTTCTGTVRVRLEDYKRLDRNVPSSAALTCMTRAPRASCACQI
jgi:hypothetical protein